MPLIFRPRKPCIGQHGSVRRYELAGCQQLAHVSKGVSDERWFDSTRGHKTTIQQQCNTNNDGLRNLQDHRRQAPTRGAPFHTAGHRPQGKGGGEEETQGNVLSCRSASTGHPRLVGDERRVRVRLLLRRGNQGANKILHQRNQTLKTP